MNRSQNYIVNVVNCSRIDHVVDLLLQLLNLQAQLFVLNLKLFDFILVVRNDFELLLDVLLLPLDLELSHDFVFIQSHVLLLEHFDLIAKSLQFEILLLFVCILDF